MLSKALLTVAVLITVTLGAVFAVLWIVNEPVPSPTTRGGQAPPHVEPAQPASAPQDAPEGTCGSYARQPEDASYTGQAVEFEDAGVHVFLREGESCTDSRGFKWGG